MRTQLASLAFLAAAPLLSVCDGRKPFVAEASAEPSNASLVKLDKGDVHSCMERELPYYAGRYEGTLLQREAQDWAADKFNEVSFALNINIAVEGLEHRQEAYPVHMDYSSFQGGWVVRVKTGEKDIFTDTYMQDLNFSSVIDPYGYNSRLYPMETVNRATGRRIDEITAVAELCWEEFKDTNFPKKPSVEAPQP